MTPDQEAIEAAYQIQIQKLFSVLVGNLVGGEEEEDCLKQFKSGLVTARKARDLVRSVIG